MPASAVGRSVLLALTPAMSKQKVQELYCYPGTSQTRAFRSQRSCHITHAASDSEIGTAGTAAVALGALANPLVLLSDYVLFTTGRGLPEGPGGEIRMLSALSIKALAHSTHSS